MVFCLRTQRLFFFFFLPFFLRMTDFLTLGFPTACQRLGCCLAKSYPARAIERALSKYTRGGALSSPRTCPAPVLGAAAHISPDQSPFRLREKNEAQEGRDLFAFPPGRQPVPCSWECVRRHCRHSRHPVPACLSVGASWRHHTGAGRKPEITFSVTTFLLWPQVLGWLVTSGSFLGIIITVFSDKSL